ncbi:MAG TPA: nuclear transport factor 2 family protein [Terriglobales bacterium]|nr:nuclear transport factor 2 family protein [Terriglobales bacterium]
MTSTTPEIRSERELLSFVYDAFNRRDIEPILARMHPEVEWPNGMEGGWVHGREGVRSYWTRQWGMLDPHVEPVLFEADNEGRVVVDVHQLVRDLAGKVLLDRNVQHIYLIKDGLIRRMDIRE